jgi:uncharacterized membrane protein YcaP (DUF421 family)
MDWSTLLRPEIPILEKIVRPLVVYAFLMLVFRLVGKRELAQLTAFDLIVLLTISNLLQNAMIGKDDSLGGGIIGALTLIVANGTIARLTLRSGWLQRLLTGKPTVLIEDGQVLESNLRRELMSRSELEQALREHDLDPETELQSVRRARLEPDGRVSVLRKRE